MKKSLKIKNVGKDRRQAWKGLKMVGTEVVGDGKRGNRQRNRCPVRRLQTDGPAQHKAAEISRRDAVLADGVGDDISGDHEKNVYPGIAVRQKIMKWLHKIVVLVAVADASVEVIKSHPQGRESAPCVDQGETSGRLLREGRGHLSPSYRNTVNTA